MVNTLDESLRALKNELRKQTALSVGLLGLASDIFPAMVERGVHPDLIAEASPQQSEDDASIHRQAPLRRVLGLQLEELNKLLSSFQNEASTGRFQAAAAIDWQTADGSKHSVALQPR